MAAGAETIPDRTRRYAKRRFILLLSLKVGSRPIPGALRLDASARLLRAFAR